MPTNGVCQGNLKRGVVFVLVSTRYPVGTGSTVSSSRDGKGHYLRLPSLGSHSSMEISGASDMAWKGNHSDPSLPQLC